MTHTPRSLPSAVLLALLATAGCNPTSLHPSDAATSDVAVADASPSRSAAAAASTCPVENGDVPGAGSVGSRSTISPVYALADRGAPARARDAGDAGAADRRQPLPATTRSSKSRALASSSSVSCKNWWARHCLAVARTSGSIAIVNPMKSSSGWC